MMFDPNDATALAMLVIFTIVLAGIVGADIVSRRWWPDPKDRDKP